MGGAGAGVAWVSVLRQLEALAQEAGTPVRYDTFIRRGREGEGSAGGLCRVGGKSMIVCDAALPVVDKVGVVARALVGRGVVPLFVPRFLRGGEGESGSGVLANWRWPVDLLGMERQVWIWLAVLLSVVGCSRKDQGGATTGVSEPSATTSAQVAAPLTLEVVFSSEKKEWVGSAITDFNASSTTTKDGRIISVHATYTGSVEPIAQIVAGTLHPHVFSPASSVVIPLLNDQWVGAKGASATPLVASADPLVLSPVVIAMWKPMAEALGWPAKKVGWGEIGKLAQSKGGWATLGHPEWGDFRFGHTHPEYSNSGLIAVLAEHYAAVGKTRDLTPADINQPKALEFVRSIEGSVVHYGKSTGFFFGDLVDHGPAYLSAAVLYENLVVTAEAAATGKPLPFPLVAIYPKEGTLWADHPYAILDAPWVGPAERDAAGKFKTFLLSKPLQQRALSSYGFRPANTDIGLGAPIDSAHGADPKEPQTLLATPDVRTARAVLDAWKQQTKRGVDVMLVFDRSGSMEGARLKGAKDGLTNFLATLRPNERVALLTFNDVLDAPSPAGEPASLLPKVTSIFAAGGTALYDAIDRARELVEGAARSDRTRIHAIVVLTDGEDRDSKLTLSQLVDRLAPPEQGSSIRVFTIGYGAEASEDILKKIATRTGAAYYHGETDNIRAVYDEIASFF